APDSVDRPSHAVGRRAQLYLAHRPAPAGWPTHPGRPLTALRFPRRLGGAGRAPSSGEDVHDDSAGGRYRLRRRAHRAVAAGTRVAVGIDLSGDWPRALCTAGFDPAIPTVWIAEGLLQYLSAAYEHRLLGRVDHLSATGSLVAIERSVDLSGDGEGRRRAQEI